MHERMVPDRFAVAFSLAGEERQLVLQVAQEVEAVLGPSTVFYDSWYEHLIAGQDSDLLLQRIYRNAELVVICVSGAYGSKSWTQAEYRAVRERQHVANAEDRYGVLPLRVADGDVEGLLKNDIVPDIREKSPTAAAELIVERLKIVRRPSSEISSPTERWPAEAPVLQWPMANHAAARAAFSLLLREGTPERILLVRGQSETGKSHMSKQMIRNATGLPGVVAGRFDFKGTTSIGVEIEAFSGPLGVEPPAGHTLNEQLGKIFTELRRRAQPSLLVLDTYEAAGEAQTWVESVLLPHVVSAPWLRVVITGQVVPTRAGATWESAAPGTLTLRSPGPEDWLVYGRENRGEDIDLEFVTKAHTHSEGKSSVLAILLGPVS